MTRNLYFFYFFMLECVDIVIEKLYLKSGIIIWYYNNTFGISFFLLKQNCIATFFNVLFKLFSTDINSCC